MTKDQYESVHDALEKSGNWPAPGLVMHVCFGGEQDLRVSEIWESRQQLEAFGEKLRPQLEAAGIQLSGQPEVFEALNVESFSAS
jgi:hypothetical protein